MANGSMSPPMPDWKSCTVWGRVLQNEFRSSFQCAISEATANRLLPVTCSEFAILDGERHADCYTATLKRS